MIIVVAKCQVIAEQIEEFKELTKELIAKSRLEEGCIEYILCEDTHLAGHFSFIEKWENEEALKEHNQSEHFLKIVPLLKQVQENDTQLNIFRSLLC